MKKLILIIGILISQTIYAGNFEQFIYYVNLLPLNERQAKIGQFHECKSHLALY